MRRPRIYTPQPLVIGDQLTLEAQAARHLIQVLRLQTGAEMILFNGGGYDWPARLLSSERRNARVEIIARSDAEPSPSLAIHLGIGISKGERMDHVIQKAVELGVSRITPLHTGRSVVRLPAERRQKRMDHWRGVVIAACEQCGRRRLPELHQHADLQGWLSRSGEGYGLLLDHRSDDTLDRLPRPSGEIYLLVGPEGGLSEQERSLALTQGFTGVRLGPRVMRTETAPLAAIAAMQMLWGDFR